MTDTIDTKRRSENMRRIKSSDTLPEMRVRRLVHGMGYRFRLHVKGLPGKPDLVFPVRRKVIFVNGCFWHQHSDACTDSRMPKSRPEYWAAKLERNRHRDVDNIAMLESSGWRTFVVWECEIYGATDSLKQRLREFLGSLG